MAYEILNSARVTPHRLHALVRLVSRLEHPVRKDLAELLQPPGLTGGGQDLVNEIFRAAVSCELIVEDSSTKEVSLAVPAQQIESVGRFRRCMQDKLLKVTQDDQPNYLLNQFAAWYAVQNERVLYWNSKQYEERFCTELYPSRGGDERPFNTTKYNGWQNWAVFVGWGWPIRFGGREVCIPDARRRIEPLLTTLLPSNGRSIAFGRFVESLADACPELDGGILFRQSWQASRGTEQRSNQVSLMLSTALRVLHDEKRVELTRSGDATDVWRLYPAAGHLLHETSHIRLLEGK